MSGSEGASPSRKPPPLPPGAEQTIAFERSSAPPVVRPKVDSLLPPGAEEFAQPPASSEPEQVPSSFVMAPVTESVIPGLTVAPAIVASKPQTASAEDLAGRRFWKHVVLCGFFIVVLIGVFYWLAR